MAKLLSGRIKHSTLANTFVNLEETEPFMGVPDSNNAISLSSTDGTRSFFNFDNSFTIDSATGTISVSAEGEPGQGHESDLVQAQIDSTLANSPELSGQAHDSNLTQSQIDSSIGELVLHDSALVQKQIDSSVTGSSIGLLTDVNLTGLAHGKILKYDSDNQEFVVATDNAESAGGGGGDSGFNLASLSVVDQGGFGFLEYSNISGIFTYQGTDSSDVTTLIDSSYIQNRINQSYIDTLDTHDSALVQGQIDSSITFQVDSAYFKNILTPNLIDELDILDSSEILSLIDDTVDSAFVRPLARAAIVAGQNVTYDSATGRITVADVAPSGVDSTATSNLIDSEYIRPLARAAITAGTNIVYDSASGRISAQQLSGIDSTATENFIDSAYVQQRVNQFYIDTLDTHDSALVVNQIEREVDSAYVRPFARASIVAGQFITYDSATGVIAATTAVDSALTLALIDSDYVQSKIKQSFIDTFDTHDSARIQTQIDSNINALTLHDSARTQSQIDSNFNDAAVFLRSDQDDIAEGNIRFNNSVELRFGETNPNQDFKIFHDAANDKNLIQATGTDSIAIAATSIVFQNKDSSDVIFQVRDSGATDLYYVRSKVAETTATGMTMNTLTATASVTVGGNEVLTTASDIHDSAAIQGQIDSNFTNDTTFVRVSGDSVTGNIVFGNRVEAQFGAGNKLAITHNDSDNENTIVTDGSAPNLRVITDTFEVRDIASETNIFAVNYDNATYLYYNKLLAAETISDGMKMNNLDVNVSVDIDSAATATIGGYRILTTNDEGGGNGLDADTLDSVQASQFLRSDQKDVKTAGSLIFNDGIAVKFGTDSDHSITETSGNLAIQTAGTSALELLTADLQIKNQANTENMITAAEDGAVTLFHDGVSRLQTTSTGVNIDDRLTVDSAVVATQLTTSVVKLTAPTQNVGSVTTTVDEFTHNGTAQSLEYTIHMKAISGTFKGETEVTKVLATIDSAGLVGFTEFGAVHSGDSDFGDFTVDNSGGNLRLRFTRRAGRNETIRVKPHRTVIS